MLEFLDDNNLTENERVDIRRILYQSSKEKSKCYFPDDIAALNEQKNNADASLPGPSLSSVRISAGQQHASCDFAESSSAVTSVAVAASAAVNFLPPSAAAAVSFAANYAAAGYGYVVQANQNFVPSINSPYLSPVTTTPPGIMPLVGGHPHPHHHPQCHVPAPYVIRYVYNPAAAAAAAAVAHDTRNQPPAQATSQIQYMTYGPAAAISYLPPPAAESSAPPAVQHADVRRILPPAVCLPAAAVSATSTHFPPASSTPSNVGGTFMPLSAATAVAAPSSTVAAADEHLLPPLPCATANLTLSGTAAASAVDELNDCRTTQTQVVTGVSTCLINSSSAAFVVEKNLADSSSTIDSATGVAVSTTDYLPPTSVAEHFVAASNLTTSSTNISAPFVDENCDQLTSKNEQNLEKPTITDPSEAFVPVAQQNFNNDEMLGHPEMGATLDDFKTSTINNELTDVANKSRDILTSSNSSIQNNNDNNVSTIETGQNLVNTEPAPAPASSDIEKTTASSRLVELSPPKFDANSAINSNNNVNTCSSNVINNSNNNNSNMNNNVNATNTTTTTNNSVPSSDEKHENLISQPNVQGISSAHSDATTPPTASHTNAAFSSTTTASTGSGSASKSWASLFKNTASANNAIVINKFVDDDICSGSTNVGGGPGGNFGNSGDSPSSPNNATSPYANVNEKSSHFPVTVTTIDRDPPAQKLGKMLRVYKLEHRGPGFQLRGLKNFGNWCYVNATLQALMACPPFVHLLRNIKNLDIRSPSCTPMLDALIKFVNEFFAERYIRKGDDKNSFEPSYVYNVLSSLRDDTSFKGRQEDAEEFLGVVLNHLHEEMAACLNYLNDQANVQNGDVRNTIANGSDSEWQQVGPGRKLAVTRTSKLAPSPVADIFSGLLKYTVQQPGAKDSVSLESFFTLQLSVQASEITSISSALQQMGRETIIKRDPNKKTEGEITRRMIFQELPLVLILHLKYFVFVDDVAKKHTKQILYGMDLQIDRQLVPSEKVGSTKNDKLSRTYKLFAVVFHHGENLEGGHYTADIFHGGSWFNMDDAKIEQVDEKHVTSYQPPRVPYLLFYRRCDMFSENRGQQQYSNN